jgi:galactokinase
LRIPLEALARQPAEALRREFAAPGRTWAGYLAGCLFELNARGLVDLMNPAVRGVNLAVLSTVPMRAGVGASAALVAATMVNLLDHFGVRDQVDAMQTAVMCQAVERQIIGANGGIMPHWTALAGEPEMLSTVLCQPHQIQPSLVVPRGMRFHPGKDARHGPRRRAVARGGSDEWLSRESFAG